MFWSKLFEPKPSKEGYLPEVDGHQVYYADYGNPRGKPVLIFHGGPGGSCKPKQTAGFDLKKYRVLMFDQRGCGKSHPLGQWNKNTTKDLLDDTIRLLNHLNINDKLILRGGSWGSTLVLLFAEKYPEKVEKLILTQIFLANKSDLQWEREGSSLFYPDIWEKISSSVSRGAVLGEYYAKLINSGERKKQIKAVSLYGAYERILGSLNPVLEDKVIDEKIVASNRIYMNYAANNFYLRDNEIMKNIKKISHLPSLILHNRLDFVCPLQGAYQLHKALPNSKLVIVPEKGHVGELLHKTIKKEMKEFLRND